MDLRSKNLSNKGMMVGDLVGVEKKEFLRLALAESRTELRNFRLKSPFTKCLSSQSFRPLRACDSRKIELTWLCDREWLF